LSALAARRDKRGACHRSVGSYRTCRRPALGAGRLRAASQRVGALLVARGCGEARVWVGRKHSCKISNAGRKFRCVGCDASSNRIPSRSSHLGQPARARREGAPWPCSLARAGWSATEWTLEIWCSLSRARGLLPTFMRTYYLLLRCEGSGLL
jgi:hypothetical protein